METKKETTPNKKERRNPQKELNEIEANSLSDTKFKVTVIKDAQGTR